MHIFVYMGNIPSLIYVSCKMNENVHFFFFFFIRFHKCAYRICTFETKRMEESSILLFIQIAFGKSINCFQGFFVLLQTLYMVLIRRHVLISQTHIMDLFIGDVVKGKFLLVILFLEIFYSYRHMLYFYLQ